MGEKKLYNIIVERDITNRQMEYWHEIKRRVTSSGMELTTKGKWLLVGIGLERLEHF